MPYTNFPYGVTSFGVPTVGGGTVPVTNGNYWWVNSGVGGNAGTVEQPYSTLAGLISAGVLAANDVVLIGPGHAETISAAGGVTLATAGVQVVGLGVGAKRPTFTFSATASTFIISGASASVSNIVGVGSIDAVVSPFSITAASVTLGLPGAPVEWQDPSSSLQAVRVVLGGTGADNLNINLKVIGIISGGTSPVNTIRLNGTNTGTITCDFYGRASTANVEFITTACTNIEVYGYMYNSGVTNYTKGVVDTATSSTWYAEYDDGSAGIPISGGSASALGPQAAATVIADLTVATADGTANVYERDVIGNKTDASVQAISATASLAAYVKGLTDAVSGTAGIASFPAAAAAANAVSLAEVIRYLSELQLPRTAIKSIAAAGASLTTGASPVTLFTVTGDVIVRVWAVVGATPLASTSNDGTLSIGVSGNTAALLPATTANGTNFTAGVVWVDNSATVTCEAFAAANSTWAPIGNGADITCTIATNSMTAGVIAFYCQYIPISVGATVVAA